MDGLKLVLLLFFEIVFAVEARPTSTVGNDFFFGLPLVQENQPAIFELLVAASNQTDFVVESSAGVLYTGNVSYAAPRYVLLQDDLEAVGDGRIDLQVFSGGFADRMKGVRVRTTGAYSISVLVIMRYPSFSVSGYSTFLLHPNNEFDGEVTYEYFAGSTDYGGSTIITDRQSNILLVGNFEATAVSITPTQTVRLPTDANIDSPLIDVTPGATHNVTLSRFQTLLISSLNDLTGTRILSSRPLTVLTGHQCAQIPVTHGFCEPLYIHIPPTINWGQRFLLTPFAGRNASQIYRIITSRNSTTIAYKCGTQDSEGTQIATAGGSYILGFLANSYCYLTASNPIFIVQVASGFLVDRLGDPAVAIVSPLTGFISNTSFTNLPSTVFPNTFITVSVQAEHFNRSQIFFDGRQLSCNWISIYNTTSDDVVGYGCTARISHGPHSVSHSGENGVLSVVTYGWNSRPAVGYAYLTGISLEVTESSTVDDVVFDEQLPFYDMSAVPGLQELPRVQDTFSPAIPIPELILYGDLFARTVYVNENGAFSFNDPWQFSHPNRFPTRYVHTRQRHVLAPFWSDNDIRREGTVRYAAFESSSSTRGDMIMSEAATYVNNRFVDDDEEVFRPTWMIIAQWDRVHPHPHGSNSHEGIPEEYLNLTNTYQGILIKGSVSSYYIFSYNCGDIQWSGQGFEIATVGYNSNADYFGNHPASGFEDIGRIVSCTRQIVPAGGRRRKRRNSGPNTTFGTAGKIFVSSTLSIGIGVCNGILGIDNILFPDITRVAGNNTFINILNQVPHCPPTRDLLRPRSEEFQAHQVVRSTECFQSRRFYTPDINPNLTTTNYEFASVCCYNQNNGAIITEGGNEGRLLNTVGMMDVKFRNDCCHDATSAVCESYRRKRPVIPVADPGDRLCAAGQTDPHYTTFDNNRYDFYESGEYTIVQIESGGNQTHNQIFHLQASLGDILPSRGFSWIRSLAFGVPTMFGYQFVNRNQPQIYKTLLPVLQEINLANDYEDDHVRITRIVHNPTTTTVTAFMKSSQIQISMRWRTLRSEIYLNFDVCVPPPLCRIATGHLGNCDGNGGNDIPPNPSQFRVLQHESLFTNDINFGRKRRQVTDFGNSSFTTPSFEDFNFTEAQRQICNNLRECLIDLAVTGDLDVAEDSRVTGENTERLQALIRNFPPSIISDSNVFNLTVGQENIYIFTVTDNNTFTVSVDDGVPQGGFLSDDGEGMYTFRWTPETTPNRTLSFIAQDELEASTLHSPVLQVCACFNGGECTLEGISSTNELLQSLICICPEAYSGDTCSEDRNGCSEIECFRGVECRDVPAPGVGAVCGSCPIGFTGDGMKCSDFDECAVDNSLCDQVCRNTFGSYECVCNPGFRLLEDSISCGDIDECSGANDCQHRCNNTQGSFLCTCEDGFILDADGRTCTPIQSCASNLCSDVCAVIEGEVRCFCPLGFELATNSTTDCEDVNECDRFSPCDQICRNTMGSFTCSCNDGYELQNATRTCEDVDECRVAALNSLVICTQANTECMNTRGGFNCICVDGYELVNGACERFVEVAPPALVVIPENGLSNTRTFTVLTFNINELTPERIQAFRIATAMAITRFCGTTECSLVTADRQQSATGVIVKPQDVAIPTSIITVNSDGRPVLSFYVQLSNNTFVSSAVVMMAIQSATDLYQAAGYIPRDPCELLPCENGATCTNTTDGFTCTCRAGYTGRNCSTNIDDCGVNPCENGGGCSDGVNGFTCTCPSGTSGDRCEVIAAGSLLTLGVIIGIAIGASAVVALVGITATVIMMKLRPRPHPRHVKDKKAVEMKSSDENYATDTLDANNVYSNIDAKY